MATRHLKRLQQQLDTKQESKDAQPSSDDEGSASPVAKAAPFNPFDLLSDDEVSWAASWSTVTAVCPPMLSEPAEALCLLRHSMLCSLARS